MIVAMVAMAMAVATLGAVAAAPSAVAAPADRSARAAHATAARTTRTALTYGPAALQTVTAFSGPDPNGRTVVLVHGGGFRSSAGDTSHLATNADSLVALGDTVFDVNYRSDVDGVGVADQVADVVAGIELTDRLRHHTSGPTRPSCR